MSFLENHSPRNKFRPLKFARFTRPWWSVVAAGFVFGMAFGAGQVRGAQPEASETLTAFTDRHCSSCHNDVDKEGGLDLTTLAFTPGDPANFLTWVKVHDRVSNGEMPPKEKKRPAAADATAFLSAIGSRLVAEETRVASQFGRVQRRRMNRSEYENTLRDIFHLPRLVVGDQLPEDGEVALFNKVSKALDVSHVHLARYMSAAQTAIREAMATEYVKPPTTIQRFYARESIDFRNNNGVPERGRFPVLGSGPDVPALTRVAPITVGDADPVKREIEAMAWTHSVYGPAFSSTWLKYRAPVTGRYNLRFSGYSIWVGPFGQRDAVRKIFYLPDHLNWKPPAPRSADAAAKGGRGGAAGPGRGGPPRETQLLPPEWHTANQADVMPGRRDEAIHIYARTPPLPGAKLGTFDVTPEPGIQELKDVQLLADEYVITDSIRFFRSRPGLTGNEQFTNSLSQRDGQPGVAFRWMEVEGPLYDAPTHPGYAVLFGDLPMKKLEGAIPGAGVRLEIPEPVPPQGFYRNGADGVYTRKKQPLLIDVPSANPEVDAERLLRGFLTKTYRRPVKDADVQDYLGLFKERYARGIGFAAAMLTTYTGILSSPEFVFLDDGASGPLNDFALATRLALFLGNASPDDRLRVLAAKGELHRPDVLRAETARLLADPNAQRFVRAFLDYWLDLRKIFDTTPDMVLYGDYFNEDSLVENGVEESRAFFTELLQKNLPARNIVDSDFTFLTERLATHYGIKGVQGVALRKVALPANSVRGGFMTQASVLKLTANGTTTSPVLRGKWIMERIVGYEIPPPPAAVPGVEPDVRGATTIRAQLDKHRADESCAMCHRNIDPPGFALESFDVLGAWRDRYRAIAKGQDPEIGFGKNGWPKTYTFALSVDPSGEMVDGRAFADVRDFKKILLQNEEQIARNLARQFMVYATGAPIRFSDRAKIEAIVKRTRSSDYGVQSILNEIVQSDLFLNK
ncbi:MAG: DUF1592 domain-containing protein [Opitutus sp.]|nr:DUF1592 domain-containing protein [Opitutus sp.]